MFDLNGIEYSFLHVYLTPRQIHHSKCSLCSLACAYASEFMYQFGNFFHFVIIDKLFILLLLRFRKYMMKTNFYHPKNAKSKKKVTKFFPHNLSTGIFSPFIVFGKSYTASFYSLATDTCISHIKK